MAVQAQLVTYPEGLQTGMSHNDDYTVRVRVPGGDWKDLFEYNVQVDMDRVQDASMVQFDMGSPVGRFMRLISVRRPGKCSMCRIRM